MTCVLREKRYFDAGCSAATTIVFCSYCTTFIVDDMRYTIIVYTLFAHLSSAKNIFWRVVDYSVKERCSFQYNKHNK